MIGMSKFVIELKGSKAFLKQFKAWLLANGWIKMRPLETFDITSKPKINFSKIKVKHYRMFDRAKAKVLAGLNIKEKYL